MNTGFRPVPTDIGFARRSARYLASQGLGPNQIRSALVEQLDITATDVDALLPTVAA